MGGQAGAAVSPGATHPSAPGPVAAHGFDGTGTRASDASDNANATTAARTQDGRLGRALDMSGPIAASIVPDAGPASMTGAVGAAADKGMEVLLLAGFHAPGSLIGFTLRLA